MKTACIVIAASIIAVPVLAQDEPPSLSNNPFSRPPSDVIIDDRVSVVAEEVSTEMPGLRATMIGSVNRLANVDGRILKIGDQVDGYRVAEIHEQYAVFERDGRRTTVFVKPLMADEENGRRL